MCGNGSACFAVDVVFVDLAIDVLLVLCQLVQELANVCVDIEVCAFCCTTAARKHSGFSV